MLLIFTYIYNYNFSIIKYLYLVTLFGLNSYMSDIKVIISASFLVTFDLNPWNCSSFYFQLVWIIFFGCLYYTENKIWVCFLIQTENYFFHNNQIKPIITYIKVVYCYIFLNYICVYMSYTTSAFSLIFCS